VITPASAKKPFRRWCSQSSLPRGVISSGVKSCLGACQMQQFFKSEKLTNRCKPHFYAAAGVFTGSIKIREVAIKLQCRSISILFDAGDNTRIGEKK